MNLTPVQIELTILRLTLMRREREKVSSKDRKAWFHACAEVCAIDNALSVLKAQLKAAAS